MVVDTLSVEIFMQEVSLDQLRLTSFTELIGSSFRVFAQRVAELELILVEASPSRRAAPNSDQADSFSLVFTGPAHRQLDQQIYRFEHARVGAFELFIVPIGSNGAIVKYEAVINRRFR